VRSVKSPFPNVLKGDLTDLTGKMDEDFAATRMRRPRAGRTTTTDSVVASIAVSSGSVL